MHSTRCLLELLLPPLLLLVATTGLARALDDDERHAMVKLHNFYRAQVSPSAANMLQMRWDEELATFAKAYAKQCVWGHNKERGRRGENLFAITDEGMDVPRAVEEWYVEREHYNLSTATCDPGQMCGHYTQVVWAKTEKIGCGSHFCETIQGIEETNIHLLVCNYEPPGNVKGQRPYQEGTPCSQCPSGYSCENSLCEPIRGSEEAQELPHLVTETPSSLATEASGSRKGGSSSSLARETPSFLVTEVSGSLTTKALPAVETKAPSSLATEGTPSMATEVPPSLTSEVPWSLQTQSPFSLDEGPATSPKLTHGPISKSVDKEASETTMPSRSPESSVHLKVSLTGTQELLPSSQREGKDEAELPSSREVLVSAFPTQAEPGEPHATLDHTGHTFSKSLPNFPNTSATANAMGGRILALQSSFPGTEDPVKPEIHSGMNSGPGRIWGPLLSLLLLPPLALVGIF
ncbi:peptidase inhibitor 16 isoform X2 [Pteronotus mesoamericanus]|uniref:peptidase inhibitor 16 isoform X2 n=1 Tax=Pteronotus mesoamericanus TaxID=1884717 RepID=UPI0023EAB695|nr:peptidase inhibitor 16 isoform X2 [Pteronotus parnellii mesoamericanus]